MFTGLTVNGKKGIIGSLETGCRFNYNEVEKNEDKCSMYPVHGG